MYDIDDCLCPACKQTAPFLEELWEAYNRGERNFESLYSKYPDIRICCRRGMVAATKIFSALANEARETNAR